MTRTDFHSLYDAHAPAVHRFALCLTGRWEEADEITAETFLRAWTATGPIREATARSYLITIARNLAVDSRRRSAREMGIDPEWPTSESSPHQKLEFELTMAAIRRLPAELSMPLTMSALGGLSYEEIVCSLFARLGEKIIKLNVGKDDPQLGIFERCGFSEMPLFNQIKIIA